MANQVTQCPKSLKTKEWTRKSEHCNEVIGIRIPGGNTTPVMKMTSPKSPGARKSRNRLRTPLSPVLAYIHRCVCVSNTGGV
jgi:hypothetical protein